MDVGTQLGALADPTRRRIFDLVRSGPLSVRELTEQVTVSQPAVSQHLRVLAEAQLVTATPEGARRLYAADPRGIEQLRSWIESMWDDVLDAFADAATTEQEGDDR